MRHQPKFSVLVFVTMAASLVRHYRIWSIIYKRMNHETFHPFDFTLMKARVTSSIIVTLVGVLEI